MREDGKGLFGFLFSPPPREEKRRGEERRGEERRGEERRGEERRGASTLMVGAVTPCSLWILLSPEKHKEKHQSFIIVLHNLSSLQWMVDGGFSHSITV